MARRRPARAIAVISGDEGGGRTRTRTLDPLIKSQILALFLTF